MATFVVLVYCVLLYFSMFLLWLALPSLYLCAQLETSWDACTVQQLSWLPSAIFLTLHASSIRHHFLEKGQPLYIIYHNCSIPSDVYKDQIVNLVGVATIVPSILFIELILSICVVNSTSTKYWPRDLKEMSCKTTLLIQPFRRASYQAQMACGPHLHLYHSW